ncbi:MAG: Cys-tRNA(Pro) deacylase [Gemmatimonadetes bacterium]|nr:Cys-tRNA(Pro) deacylase [Gemmatimonadota bacterium]
MTPAVIAVQQARIAHRLHEYQHDPDAAAYGAEAADKLGVDPRRIFKTLIASVDGRLAVAIVPVADALDLKALAAALGGKRAAMAGLPEAERATGYVAGGISPLGQRKRLPTVLDASAAGWDTVYVSAGRRGLQLEHAPADLPRLTGARTARLAR